MKALKIVLVVFAFSFTLLTLFSVSNVEAMEYLGDYCFRLETDSKANDGRFDMRLAVVHIGNEHYSLYGKAELVDYYGIEVPVHGNAEIGSDGKIICTLVGSGKNDNNNNMMGIIFHIKLDNISIGRYEAIGPAKEGAIEIQYVEGDITNIPCQ